MYKKILTIAGSDTLAGGGLLADIKTFEDYGCFGLSVITCIATVNHQEEFVLENLPIRTIRTQLETIKNQVSLDAIKIGLLNSTETIDLVAAFLDEFPGIPVVLDPVLAFKESTQTIHRGYMDALIEKLFPRATIITPNLKEASLLSGQTIQTLADLKAAGNILLSLGAPAVVIKGGQRFPGSQAFDLYLDPQQEIILEKEKISSSLVNGAGCTFASSIASLLASGQALDDSVRTSKNYVYEAIQHGISLNNHFGNVWHNPHYLKEGEGI